MKLNYVVIPLMVVMTSFIGSRFTSAGMDWYRTISLPSWTPAGGVIGAVWTILFVLATISILIVWNTFDRDATFNRIIFLFCLNAVLNIGWSYLFFYHHSIGVALIEMLFLFASVVALIIMIMPESKIAGVLLMPYAAWVLFATYLTVTIWNLNR